MAAIMHSDIAKLVLDYFAGENLPEVFELFCKQSPYLKEEHRIQDGGSTVFRMNDGNLYDIIQELVEINELVGEYVKTLPETEEILKEKNLVNKIKLLLYRDQSAIPPNNIEINSNMNQKTVENVLAQKFVPSIESAISPIEQHSNAPTRQLTSIPAALSQKLIKPVKLKLLPIEHLITTSGAEFPMQEPTSISIKQKEMFKPSAKSVRTKIIKDEKFKITKEEKVKITKDEKMIFARPSYKPNFGIYTQVLIPKPIQSRGDDIYNRFTQQTSADDVYDLLTQQIPSSVSVLCKDGTDGDIRLKTPMKQLSKQTFDVETPQFEFFDMPKEDKIMDAEKEFVDICKKKPKKKWLFDESSDDEKQVTPVEQATGNLKKRKLIELEGVASKKMKIIVKQENEKTMENSSRRKGKDTGLASNIKLLNNLKVRLELLPKKLRVAKQGEGIIMLNIGGEKDEMIESEIPQTRGTRGKNRIKSATTLERANAVNDQAKKPIESDATDENAKQQSKGNKEKNKPMPRSKRQKIEGATPTIDRQSKRTKAGRMKKFEEFAVEVPNNTPTKKEEKPIIVMKGKGRKKMRVTVELSTPKSNVKLPIVSNVLPALGKTRRAGVTQKLRPMLKKIDSKPYQSLIENPSSYSLDVIPRALIIVD